jgi:putative DNA primase/helicase
MRRPQDEVLAELMGESDGILSWMVEGFRDWQADHGWQAQAVKAATNVYRNTEDVLGQFLDDCTTKDPASTVVSATLYEAYAAWCARSGEEPIKKNAFASRLAGRGMETARGGHGIRKWRGLKLNPDVPTSDQPPLEEEMPW